MKETRLIIWGPNSMWSMWRNKHLVAETCRPWAWCGWEGGRVCEVSHHGRENRQSFRTQAAQAWAGEPLLTITAVFPFIWFPARTTGQAQGLWTLGGRGWVAFEELAQYQFVFGADAHPEPGQEAGGSTLTPLIVVMDLWRFTLRISSADLGFNQSTDTSPGESESSS